MPGWGKLVAGAILGAAGALYATNEELRKQLPKAARDLPVAVRRRFEAATEAGREASARRRAEILRELESHGGNYTEHRALETPPGAPPEVVPPPREIEEPVARQTEDA